MKKHVIEKYGNVSRLQKKLIQQLETQDQIERERRNHRDEEYDLAKTKARDLRRKIELEHSKRIVDDVMTLRDQAQRAGKELRGEMGEHGFIDLNGGCNFIDGKSGSFTVHSGYKGHKHVGIFVQFGGAGPREYIGVHQIGKTAKIEGYARPLHPVCDMTSWKKTIAETGE